MEVASSLHNGQEKVLMFDPRSEGSRPGSDAGALTRWEVDQSGTTGLRAGDAVHRPQTSGGRQHARSRNQSALNPGHPPAAANMLQGRVARQTGILFGYACGPKGSSMTDINGIEGVEGQRDAWLVAPSA